MTNKYVFSLAAVAATGIASLVFCNDAQLHSNSTGAPGSGSCTACHGTSVKTDPSFEIIVSKNGTPVTSYVPGETYDVVLGMQKSGITRFGFALSANRGTVGVDPSNTRTQKISSYATHTSGGTVSPTAGTTQWKCRWTAPHAGSGNVNLQVYINATNNDGSSNGDEVYGKFITLAEGVTGITDVIDEKQIAVYPNPVKDRVNLRYHIAQQSEVSIRLVAINGQELETLFTGKVNAGEQQQELVLNNSYARGTYLLRIEAGAEMKYQKIFMQ